jgi:hypothetical protein
MTKPEDHEDLTPEELEGQEPEQLPHREAMSVLYPPSPTGPIPLSDPDGIMTIGPEPVPGESVVPPDSA